MQEMKQLLLCKKRF